MTWGSSFPGFFWSQNPAKYHVPTAFAAVKMGMSQKNGSVPPSGCKHRLDISPLGCRDAAGSTGSPAPSRLARAFSWMCCDGYLDNACRPQHRHRAASLASGVARRKASWARGCQLHTEHPWGRSTAGQDPPENRVSTQSGAVNRGAGWFLAGAAAAL